jgi:AraC family transcriptional regulator
MVDLPVLVPFILTIPMSFEVSVVEFPAKHLIGTKVRASMQSSSTDCPALWQAFAPRIAEISTGNESGNVAFGVSVMVNDNDFDYWAAVEALSSVAVPAGMQTTEISAGLYAKCSVANMEKLGEAFMYVYTQWTHEQSEYRLNMNAPCFELYPPGWQPDNAVEIYSPVLKN